MRKELRFFLCGTLAGIVLGAVAASMIPRRQHNEQFGTTTKLAATRRKATQVSLIAPQSSVQIPDASEQASTNGPRLEFTSISITPSCSMKFSAPFVNALREMKAGGESPDVLVNTVVAEFNRQRVILVNAVHRKLERGEIDFDESQDFFHARNEPLGKAIAEILGDDCFRHWDKQRLLRSVTTGGYKLNAAESDELYRIEKEHEQRNAELTRTKENGELDPMDFEAQRSKAEEEYQKERAELVNEEHKGRGDSEHDSRLAVLKSMTRDLNLTPQQLNELSDVTRKNIQAERELLFLHDDAARAEKERALQATAENEFLRILGPQRVAELKRANDFHYQTMKQYQELWRLTDSDVNHLYEFFASHEKTVEDYQKQAKPSVVVDAEGNEQPAPDQYLLGLNQELQAKLLRYLGEERYRRFKAAGLVPED
jgi:hypothetical protein